MPTPPLPPTTTTTMPTYYFVYIQSPTSLSIVYKYDAVESQILPLSTDLLKDRDRPPSHMNMGKAESKLIIRVLKDKHLIADDETSWSLPMILSIDDNSLFRNFLPIKRHKAVALPKASSLISHISLSRPNYAPDPTASTLPVLDILRNFRIGLGSAFLTFEEARFCVLVYCQVVLKRPLNIFHSEVSRESYTVICHQKSCPFTISIRPFDNPLPPQYRPFLVVTKYIDHTCDEFTHSFQSLKKAGASNKATSRLTYPKSLPLLFDYFRAPSKALAAKDLITFYDTLEEVFHINEAHHVTRSKKSKAASHRELADSFCMDMFHVARGTMPPVHVAALYLQVHSPLTCIRLTYQHPDDSSDAGRYTHTPPYHKELAFPRFSVPAATADIAMSCNKAVRWAECADDCPSFFKDGIPACGTDIEFNVDLKWELSFFNFERLPGKPQPSRRRAPPPTEQAPRAPDDVQAQETTDIKIKVPFLDVGDELTAADYLVFGEPEEQGPEEAPFRLSDIYFLSQDVQAKFAQFGNIALIGDAKKRLQAVSNAAAGVFEVVNENAVRDDPDPETTNTSNTSNATSNNTSNNASNSTSSNISNDASSSASNSASNSTTSNNTAPTNTTNPTPTNTTRKRAFNDVTNQPCDFVQSEFDSGFTGIPTEQEFGQEFYSEMGNDGFQRMFMGQAGVDSHQTANPPPQPPTKSPHPPPTTTLLPMTFDPHSDNFCPSYCDLYHCSNPRNSRYRGYCKRHEHHHNYVKLYRTMVENRTNFNPFLLGDYIDRYYPEPRFCDKFQRMTIITGDMRRMAQNATTAVEIGHVECTFRRTNVYYLLLAVGNTPEGNITILGACISATADYHAYLEFLTELKLAYAPVFAARRPSFVSYAVPFIAEALAAVFPDYYHCVSFQFATEFFEQNNNIPHSKLVDFFTTPSKEAYLDATGFWANSKLGSLFANPAVWTMGLSGTPRFGKNHCTNIQAVKTLLEFYLHQANVRLPLAINNLQTEIIEAQKRVLDDAPLVKFAGDDTYFLPAASRTLAHAALFIDQFAVKKLDDSHTRFVLSAVPGSILRALRHNPAAVPLLLDAVYFERAGPTPIRRRRIRSTQTLSRYEVDLARGTCSCTLYQDTQLPCIHALACITSFCGGRVSRYSSPIYHYARYRDLLRDCDAQTLTPLVTDLQFVASYLAKLGLGALKADLASESTMPREAGPENMKRLYFLSQLYSAVAYPAPYPYTISGTTGGNKV